MWQQRIISLRPRERGFHLVTEEVLGALPELAQVRVGLLHLWLQHTSASLTVNENADPAVRRDFERFFNRLVPQGEAGYEHDDEGPDDLPAHFKGRCGAPLPRTRRPVEASRATPQPTAQCSWAEVSPRVVSQKWMPRCSR